MTMARYSTPVWCMGDDGMCDHAFKRTRRGDNGYLSYITMIRDRASCHR